jgi:replicative superfamily II helicase
LGVLASQIKADRGCTLIFVKSRSDAMSLALKLAGSLGYAPAKKALKRLESEEPSFLLRSLCQALSHGVAFHSSDLCSTQRETIEQAFVDGEVSVLCSTTTLALGVNLPADTVYLETVKYASGVYAGRPELVPISRSEFDNMTGRAGRLGHERTKPGRAIVLAESEFDSDILWDSYIAPGLQRPIESAFDSLAIEDWVLSMVVAGLASDRTSLSELRRRTLKARLDRSTCGGDDSYPQLDTALVVLHDGELVTTDEAGRLAPTPIGAATAGSGLGVAETIHYRRRLDTRGYPETVFGWTCLALGSPNWVPPPGMLSWYEQVNNLPVKMLYRRFDHSVEEAIGLLPENHRRQPLDYRRAAALKGALLLDEWCRLVPVQKLEERFRLHLGQIQSLGSTAAHLVAALGSLIRAGDRESDRPPLLNQQAFSLRFGLPPSFETMHRHLSGVLQRSDFLAIHGRGIESFEEVAAMSCEMLEGLLDDMDKSNTVYEICNNLKEEVDMQSATAQVSAPVGHQPQLVEIDGAYEADRYLVRINGFPVHLTGKSFKYLTKLAWSRVNDDSGWVYKDDIEVGFNQARYLYRMKNEIASGFKSDWPIIENNRLGYYRLHIAPDKIKLNIDSLKDHPDYELRRLFEAGGETDRMN